MGGITSRHGRVLAGEPERHSVAHDCGSTMTQSRCARRTLARQRPGSLTTSPKSNRSCVYSWREQPHTHVVFKSRLKAAIESKDRGSPGTPGHAERDLGSSLPFTLTDNEDIEAICKLVHTGQAKAVMQVVVDPRAGMPLPGVVVSEITPSGWIALQAHLGKNKIKT